MKPKSVSLFACLLPYVAGQAATTLTAGPTIYSKFERVVGCCTETVAGCITRCGVCVNGQADSRCGANYTMEASCDLDLLDTESPINSAARDVLGFLCQAEADTETPIGNGDNGNYDGFCLDRCGLTSWSARDLLRQCYEYPGADGLGKVPGQPLCASEVTITYFFDGANLTNTDHAVAYVESLYDGLDLAGLYVYTDSSQNTSARRNLQTDQYELEATLTTERQIIAGAQEICFNEDTKGVATISGQAVAFYCEKEFPDLPVDPCAALELASSTPIATGPLSFLGDVANAALGCPSCRAVLSSVVVTIASVVVAVCL